MKEIRDEQPARFLSVEEYLKEKITQEEKGITEKTTSLAESKAKLKSLKAALKALEPKKKKE